jgi:hypothetical protein
MLRKMKREKEPHCLHVFAVGLLAILTGGAWLVCELPQRRRRDFQTQLAVFEVGAWLEQDSTLCRHLDDEVEEFSV